VPKMKSNSGAKKRFKLTKNGKIKKAKSFKSHILEKKSPKRKRNLRGTGVVCKTEVKRIRHLLPYL
jgi:large subunit ribosomal protein L35